MNRGYMRTTAQAVAVAALCVGSHATAYKQPTHMLISLNAARASVLAQTGPGSKLADLGLQYAINDENQKFPNSVVPDEYVDSETVPIIALIQDGAAFEDSDSGHRSLNHFYDPVSGLPLNGTCASIGQFLTGVTALTSPDWALKDQGQPIAGQNFSYADARQYFFNALTTVDKTGRDQNWGKVFQTLGQVMHHIQDMAQPQHVRNDSHLDQYKALGLNPCYNLSLYEVFSNDNRTTLPFSSSSFPGVVDISKFPTPRSLWTNPSGSGIAQFTNSNFLSAGTNFNTGAYNLPLFNPNSRTDIDIQQLCASSPSFCQNPNLRGLVTFYANTVQDNYTGQPSPNPYASTYSIFDADLQKAGRSPVFTLNKFNLSAAQGFLIPRAVAYSAGLINYFFRGQLQISLPDEGVYAIVDHTVASGNDPTVGGFPAIKLRVRNVTPTGEQIPDGQNNTTATGNLYAVAKFHRNTCYASDLSGEYGSAGILWGPSNPPGLPKSSCRSEVEEIVMSDKAAVPLGINTNPVPVTFKFSQKVIPIRATDLFLQVVYRGPLGQETDSVIVATKDISEPTYVFSYSRKDQYSYCHGWPVLNQGSESCPSSMFPQWCASGSFASTYDCARAESLTDKNQYSKDSSPVPGWDPSTSSIPQGTFVDMSQEPSLTPVMTRPAPVGTLARVAVLFDVNPTNVGVLVQEHVDPTHNTRNFQWFAGKAGPPTIVQLDPTTHTLNPSVTYGLARGVYLPSGEVPLVSSGDAQTIPPFVLGPSQFAGSGGWYWPSN